jgi:SAM-dependent methyltransferase
MARTDALTVDPGNSEALRAWDGTDGDYWVANESIFDNGLSRYQQRFLEAARIEATDRVLDVGCGTGQATRDAARAAGSGSALGVDLSSRMVECAQLRAHEEGIANARFLQADAQVHPFGPSTFDVAISRTGSMFFADPVAAFTNIAEALVAGGRLVLLVWQPLARNHWVRDLSDALAAGREMPTRAPDAPGPFSLSSPDRVRSILTAGGFTDTELEGVDELMWFGDSAEQAHRFLCGLGFTEFMLNGLDDDARRAALADLRASIEAHATNAGVLYPSAAWIVTATRV